MFPITGTFYNSKSKVWSGPNFKDLYNMDMTLAEAILRELRKNPQKIIQISDPTGEMLTAQQFMDYSRNLAKNLIDMEIGPGDVIGLYAQNSTHVATVMMAAFLIGAPVNALYPGFDKENVKLLFKDTRPRIIFCDKENFINAEETNLDMNLNATIVIINGEAEETLNIKSFLVFDSKDSLDSIAFPCVHMTGADTAVILCSSGTTGKPKGVMCSHHVLLNKNIYSFVPSNAVLFCFSTMYWGSGLLNLLSSLLNSTLRIVTHHSFSPDYLLQLIERHQITHLLVSPNQMGELLLTCDRTQIRKSFATLNTLLCGGSKVPLVVQESLVDILSDNRQRPGFSIMYGMSEVAGGISLNAGTPFEFLLGSEGKLLPNVQARIVDKSGQHLEPNESGEILIYNPYNWLGYYKDPEATRKAFSGEWLHTGDIGHFDDEGFLHVSGRDKDMFKYKNFQICPQLIEDVILQIKGVAEVCVFPKGDFVTETLIACAIVRTDDEVGKGLLEEKVMEHVSINLDSLYHLRGGVFFVNGIPKTSSGKIQRQRVPEVVDQCGKQQK